eukprot:symbB.v1.2.030568.t1/scaffold3460.1/size56314/5
MIVNVYLDILVQVRKKLPSNRLFVHPVPTVLPETRFLTMAMNVLLETDWSQLSMEKVRVKLLRIQSIFEEEVPDTTDALTLSKLQLLPELRLDGIHLSTVYVKSHLAPAEAMEALRIWKMQERDPLRYTQIGPFQGRSSLKKIPAEGLQRQTVRELKREGGGSDSTTNTKGRSSHGAYKLDNSRPGTAGSSRSFAAVSHYGEGSSQSTRASSRQTPSLVPPRVGRLDKT